MWELSITEVLCVLFSATYTVYTTLSHYCSGGPPPGSTYSGPPPSSTYSAPQPGSTYGGPQPGSTYGGPQAGSTYSPMGVPPPPAAVPAPTSQPPSMQQLFGMTTPPAQPQTQAQPQVPALAPSEH